MRNSPKACREFELWLAADDPDERAGAARHGLECPACRATYAAQKRLTARIEGWQRAVDPPPELEDRVRAAVRRRVGALNRAAKAQRGGHPSPGRRHRLALAAALLLAVGLGMWLGFRPSVAPSQASDLLVVEALAEARRVERQHARAIASLEEAVAVRLARAEDPLLPAAEAALLFSYRDRLASLESTIGEVQGFLRTNPAHTQARTVLLAAYRDKTQVLREILALGEPT